MLDLLTHLLEKSLVELELEGERYRLLATVRQYAQERLAEACEGDGARARHLAFYLALAQEAEVKLRGPEQGAWLSRLVLEQENLLLAHAWCDRVDGGAQIGLTLVWALQ
ncbi:MAG TPA: AfsR/SARP family transcriptional regulator, partial [Phycisphaerae bacterium]